MLFTNDTDFHAKQIPKDSLIIALKYVLTTVFIALKRTVPL